MSGVRAMQQSPDFLNLVVHVERAVRCRIRIRLRSMPTWAARVNQAAAAHRCAAAAAATVSHAPALRHGHGRAANGQCVRASER